MLVRVGATKSDVLDKVPLVVAYLLINGRLVAHRDGALDLGRVRIRIRIRVHVEHGLQLPHANIGSVHIVLRVREQGVNLDLDLRLSSVLLLVTVLGAHSLIDGLFFGGQTFEAFKLVTTPQAQLDQISENKTKWRPLVFFRLT